MFLIRPVIEISEGWGILLGAVITAIPALIAIYATYKHKNKELDMTQAELDFQRYSLDFGQFLNEWGDTHQEILNLINTTKIDQFMILRAWNGENNPKWTTSVLQIRESDHKPVSYIHFELDSDYVNRLRSLKISNYNYHTTEDLPDCAVKDVYLVEGVKSSLWALIGFSDVIDGKQAVTYCSFTTRDPEPITPEEVTKCKILMGRLKGIQNLFTERNDLKK